MKKRRGRIGFLLFFFVVFGCFYEARLVKCCFCYFYIFSSLFHLSPKRLGENEIRIVPPKAAPFFIYLIVSFFYPSFSSSNILLESQSIVRYGSIFVSSSRLITRTEVPYRYQSSKIQVVCCQKKRLLDVHV